MTKIKKLLEVWEQRPRKIIDFSDPADQTFINNVLGAVRDASLEMQNAVTLIDRIQDKIVRDGAGIICPEAAPEPAKPAAEAPKPAAKPKKPVSKPQRVDPAGMFPPVPPRPAKNNEVA